MEKGLLQQANIMKLLEPLPRIALFIDKTDDPDEEAHKQLMLTKYNKSGSIPAYYLIDGAGDIKAAQVGATVGASGEETFLNFLKAGGL